MKLFTALFVFVLLSLVSLSRAQGDFNRDEGRRGIAGSDASQLDSAAANKTLSVESILPGAFGKAGSDAGVRVLSSGDRYNVTAQPSDSTTPPPKPSLQIACVEAESLKPDAASMAASLRTISTIMTMQFLFTMVAAVTSIIIVSN